MTQTTTTMAPKREGAPCVDSVLRPRFLSRSLYMDTLRRLRLTGLLLVLACTLLTISGLLPSLYSERAPYFRLILNPEQFGNILTVFALLSPALLMMQTFFFLYRRNGSDLYHSLPYSRRSLCLSLTAASLTWSVASVAIPIALCAVLIPFSPLPFPMALLGWMFIHHLVTILLITGCALIGASLSGTPLSGVIITGMVLFLPRWAMTVYRYILANVSGIMTYNDISRLLSPAMHLPSADLTLLFRGSMELPRFFGMTYSQFFHNIPGILYTLALSVAALGIGLLCFVRRRSERAGQAVEQSKWQYALHAAIAVTALLWGAYFLHQGYKQYHGNWLTDRQVMMGIAAVVIVCLVLYLGYLWLRSKTWRAAAHAAPFMALAVALALAICWGATETGFGTRKNMPGTAEIVSVRFPSEPGDQTFFFTFYDGQNLLASHISSIWYDSPDMRQLAADAMAEYVSTLDAYAAGQDIYLPFGTGVTMEVELAGGGFLRRTVRLPEGRLEQYRQLLFESPEFISALRQTPNSPYLSMDTRWNFLLPDDTHTAAIWNTYQSELSRLSDLEFLRRCSLRYYLPSAQDDDYVRLGSFVNLTAYTWHGMDLYGLAYNVGPETPLTLDTCIQESNRRTGEEFEAALEAAKALNFEQSRCYLNLEFTYSISMEGFTQKRMAYLRLLASWQDGWFADPYGYGMQADREEYEAFRGDVAEKLQDIFLRSPMAQDGGEPLVWASIYVEGEAPSYNAVNGNAYIQVSEADFALLTELALQIEQNRYY